MKTITKSLFFWVLIGVTFFVEACVSPPQGQADITFNYLTPDLVNVSDISVRDQYTPPMTAPYIEHTLVNRPYTATLNMLNAGFAANANFPDRLELTIKTAEITKELTDDTVSGFRLWQNQQAYSYKGKIVVDVVLRQTESPFAVLGSGQTTVRRELTLPENMSVSDRELALTDMVQNMVLDARKGVRKILKDKFLILQ